MGQIGGTIIGIPKGSPHPDEAWLLSTYMATDTRHLVYMANNCSGTSRRRSTSLQSPDLDVTPQFQTFLDIFKNPASRHTRSRRPIGVGRPGHLMAAFAAKWQAGKVTDLQAGLADAAQQINDQLAQAAI